MFAHISCGITLAPELPPSICVGAHVVVTSGMRRMSARQLAKISSARPAMSSALARPSSVSVATVSGVRRAFQSISQIAVMARASFSSEVPPNGLDECPPRLCTRSTTSA